jgi:hypothetical protein
MSLRGGCPLPFIYYTYGNDVCGPARENENMRKKEMTSEAYTSAIARGDAMKYMYPYTHAAGLK